MGAIINEKIIEFAFKNSLNVVGQHGRDRKSRDVKYYIISTKEGIAIGTIKPDCSYEQFLEKIASNAILKVGGLCDLNDELEQDYEDMCGNFATLKEATNDI